MTVWPVGWRGRVLAAPLVIEIAYDLMLQAVFVKSLIDIATGRSAGWNYVPDRRWLSNDVLSEESCFSSDLLRSPFFQALATFVAINTLVYAGLSLAKLFPRRRE